VPMVTVPISIWRGGGMRSNECPLVTDRLRGPDSAVGALCECPHDNFPTK